MAATTRPSLSGVSGERIDYTTSLPQSTKLLILAAALLSLFLAALDQTIVATALPAIVRDFNGIDLVSWVSTSYLLASTATVPIYGKLSDMYGRKFILLWGISIFLIGSILCGIAGSMIQLVLFRVVQGLGAAAITSTAFSIPADLFAPADRPKYMGLFPAVFGLSSVIGPFIGGILTDQISWHWVFYVNIPLGLVALGFIMLKMPRLASGLRAKIDWLGTILLIGAVVPFMLGLTLDKTLYAWSSPMIIGLFLVAIVSLVLFLVVERRAESPVLSFNLFRNQTFTVGVIISMLNGAAFFGAVLFLSLFFVNVLGLSATEAGTAQIPLMIGFVISSNVSSLIVQRTGRYKPLIIGGFALLIIGFILMSLITMYSSVFDVAWRIFLIGVGLGPAMPLLNLAVQNAVPPQQIGAVTANRQFFQQLGQAVGGAVFGLVLTTSLTVQLQQNFTPITQNLPAAAQTALDPARFRNSANVSEGGSSGEQVDLGAEVVAAASAPLEAQRTLVQAALGSGDATAREQLIGDPNTLPAVLSEVQASTGADEAALARAQSAIDTAEQTLQAEAQLLGEQVNTAVKQSYATSVTHIYFYSIWLAIAALVIIIIWLPEVPLRGGKAEPAVMD